MTIEPGRRHPHRIGPRRAAAAVLVLGGLAAPATATAAPNAPTLTATTTVAGAPLPTPLVSGTWQNEDSVWVARLTTGAPPGGRTVVSASWRTPKASAKKGLLFATRSAIQQQELSGRYTYSTEVRVCTSRGCHRWFGMSSDRVPSYVDAATLPYTVRYGHGLSVEIYPSRSTVWFEWRYRHVHESGSIGDTTVRVAVGAAARALV